jgi:3-deoxy-D-manno-octulosonic-acid transferase
MLFVPDVATLSGRIQARAGLLLLAVVLLGGGLIGVWRLALSPLLDAWRSRDWVQVMAKIETLALAQDARGVQLRTRYAYRVEGVLYRASRYGLHRGTENAEAARAAYAELLYRNKVWVWVNPEAPGEALMNRDIHWSIIVFALPAVAAAALGALLFWAAGSALRQQYRESQRANKKGMRYAWRTMCFLYSLFFWLALPWLMLRLLWRSRQQADCRRHWRERFGFYAPRAKSPLLWVHAVSLGETRAAAPLVAKLLAAYPQHVLLLTSMTPTGRAAGAALYGDNERVMTAYLPWDTPDAARRFFQHFRPAFGVLLETEIWPNLLFAARRQDVPVLLVNARLSRRSARGYARIGALARPAFACLAAVAAQERADARRLAFLGAKRISLCGNLKFDAQPAPELLARGKAWRAAIMDAKPRPIWLAASTRAGEESLLLDILAQLWARCSQEAPLLVLTPRHPQRFDAVAALVRARGLVLARRGAGLPTPETQVWLGDSMGELAAYYALADVAFIGGSLLPLGGQNLIEAAACACPALLGPHTFNFARASREAVRAGAALRVDDAKALLEALSTLLADPKRQAAMRLAALAFAAQHQGATARILALLQAVFQSPSAERTDGLAPLSNA